MPSTAPLTDFNTGNEMIGWTCIGFTPPPGTINCSYGYRAGSGYIAPFHGGDDPGPTGFEVVAQGDDDADGVASTFAIAGILDVATGQIVLQPRFEHQPDE